MLPANGTQENNSGKLLTIAQLTVSGLGMLFSFAGAALLILIGLIGFFGENMDRETTTALFGLGWICLLVTLLSAPSLALSIQRLWGKTLPLPQLNGFRLASLLLLIWPLVLVLGNLLADSRMGWLILPPLQILAFGLPIWWLVEMARRRLASGSLQRSWGLLNFSLLITTPVVIVVELIVLALLFVLFAFWLSTQPALVSNLQDLAQRMLNANGSPEMILELARPYLQNPLVIFSALAILGGLMPMIEELLKPLALWPLVDHRLTPAEGFSAGAICGAAFALLESLLNLSAPAENGWVMLAVGRSGTGLLHITTTALIGWAMASAWASGTYLRLFLTYLLSVTLHGLWNVLSVLAGLSVIFDRPPDSLRLVDGLSQAAPIGIVILGLILFVLLWGSNRRLQREKQSAEFTLSDSRTPTYHLESTIHGNDPQSH